MYIILAGIIGALIFLLLAAIIYTVVSLGGWWGFIGLIGFIMGIVTYIEVEM